MKKTLFLLTFLSFFLLGCEEKPEEPQSTTEEKKIVSEAPLEAEKTEVSETEVEKMETEEKTESFIKISSPADGTIFHTQPIVFTGEVSADAEKIIVTAYYPSRFNRSVTVTDVYTLSEFKTGDSTFVYRAKDTWSNLGQGMNSYNFVAYFEDGSEKSATANVWFEYEMPSDQ